MADLIDLGFELSAKNAEDAIETLMGKFNELEKTKSSVSKFEFTGLENLSQVAKQFRTISSSVEKINKMFGGAAASEAAKQVDSLNIRIGETGKLMQEVGNYRFKTGAELAANEVKVFEASLNAAAAKLSELSVVQQKISYGGKSSTPAGMSQLAEQLGKLEGQISPLGSSFKATFTVITQSIGQAKTQAARFNGEVSKIAVSLNKTGTSIGKITAQMRQLAEAVSRTALRTAATGSAMEKMASVNPVNPAAIASVDQLKMKLQEASLAARSFRPIGKIGGSVSVGGLRDMTGGFNQANFAARNLRDTLISMATGGGLAYYFADVTRAAVKFGEELSYIQSLTLDFSKQDMRAGILNMGSMLGDATKNAEAAYYAYSSGVRGGEKGIINFTGNMAKLAKIIRADVIPTVNSVTTIMNAYNLTAADSAELTDLFYGIIKYGKASGPQLASGLGQVAPTAATAELSLNELGASVAALTRVSNTRNAITYFNNMLTKLIKPTKEARLAAQKLGIELGLDAVRAKGFTALMQEIREKTQGSQQALTALFPDIRGMRAALQLLNRGWGDFSNMLEIFSNKAGIADEAFQNLEEDLNQQLGALPVTFNKIKIAAGGTITNILTLGGTLAPLIRDFNNMDESGQKLAGGIALVVGGLVTMKIAGLTLNTVKAMEIRNNAIILEQQKQERRNRAALTLAVAKEAAAKKAAAASAPMVAVSSVSGGIRAIGRETRIKGLERQSAFFGQKALEQSQKMDYAREIHDYRLWFQARKNFLAAEKAAERANLALYAAKNKMIAAQNVHLAVNVGLNRKMAVGNSFTKIIEGQGFIGGFGRSGVANRREVRRMLKFEGLGLSMSKLGAGVGKLSASFLGLIPIVTKIGIVAGAVAAVGGLIDIITSPKIDNGLNAAGNSRIVGAIADELYNFFTGAFDKAKEFEDRMKMLAESRGQIFANMDTLFLLTDKYLQNSSDPKKMTGSMLDTLQKNYKMAYDNLTTGTVKTMQAELKNVTKRMAKLQPELASGFNMSEAVMRLNKKYNANLQIRNGDVTASGLNISNGDVVMAQLVGPLVGRFVSVAKAVADMSENDKKALAAYQEEKAAFDAKIKEQNDLMKKSEELTNAIAKGKAQYDKYATQLVSYWKAQQEALEIMSDMIAKQRFNMLDPNEQIKKLIENADAGFEGFSNLIKSNTQNASMLKDSFNSFLTPANDAIARLKKNIEGFDKMIESTMKNAFNYRYAGAGTDADRIEMMNDRATQLMEESGITVKQDTWAKDFQARVRKAMARDIVKNDPKMISDYQKLLEQTNPLLDKLIINIPKNTDFDFQKSYAKVTESIQLQIDAKKTEIEQYKHLAEAERRANEKTLDLIRSMDKMSVTAVDAVDATSLDAVKLQSRSFAELPQMNFARNAENDLGSAQQELRKIYEQAAKIVEAFTQEAETRKQEDQDSVNALNEKITTAMGQVENKIKEIEKTVKDNHEKMKNEVTRIEGEKMTMMRTITANVTKLGQNTGTL